MEAGRAALERSLRGTARSSGCVGAGTLALGVFLAAVHLLRLDPTVDEIPPFGVLLLYAFACLFAVAGATLIRTAVVRHRASARVLLRLLDHEPDRIERIRVDCLDGEEQSQPVVEVVVRGGAVHRVLVPSADVDAVLAYLTERAPGATDAPP
jgi:hypothetical protein